MDNQDYDPTLDSRYNCDKCEDSGIDIESREYCEHCQSGARRCNNDKFAEMLRGSPFLDAMWAMHQSTVKTAKAIAAADLALLKSKLLQAERELAEVRKVQEATTGNEWSEAQRIQNLPDVDDALRGFIIDTTGDNGTIVVRAVMRAILAAKEQA